MAINKKHYPSSKNVENLKQIVVTSNHTVHKDDPIYRHQYDDNRRRKTGRPQQNGYKTAVHAIRATFYP